jgi:hypothetical protein
MYQHQLQTDHMSIQSCRIMKKILRDISASAITPTHFAYSAASKDQNRTYSVVGTAMQGVINLLLELFGG